MTTANLGLYSVDPPALDAFHAFDPESFVALLAINDALIAIGPDGDVVPSLAIGWEQTSPVTLEMTLREGVRFHNGEPFDADSVVATFHHHHHPTPSACGGGILASISAVERLGPHRIRITTAFPDAMLLRRLFFFAVYPKGVLASEGRDAMLAHPIGTGAFRFVHWRRGEEILLARNQDHFAGGQGVDQVRIPIVRQREWVDRLACGSLDVALNIDSHDAVRASRMEGVEVGRRDAALSQWFLLANRGPLADVRVRQALNHAIKRSLIAEVSEHGFARPQRSVATQESWGHADDVTPYHYSPDLSARMLAEAGFEDGFTLRGLVSETSTGVYFAVREFLARVGVTLEAEIVPRSQWIGRVVGGNLSGNPYDGDFAVSIVDNPLLDSLFHQFIFLFSQGLFSLTRDESYDQAFLKAATTVGEQGETARQALERYAAEQAMLLFTVQQQVHAAWRQGCHVPMPKSGHFNSDFWWKLDVPTQEHHARPATVTTVDQDVRSLLEATGHTGTFFLPESHHFDQPWAQQLWGRLRTSEERWRLGYEPMLRELVTQIEARNDLASILGSTQRVAIVGYGDEGQKRYGNAGFDTMFGSRIAHVAEVIDTPSWDTIETAIASDGSWLGPVTLDPGRLPAGAASQLYMTATPALDDEGARTGITLVFSDFSGEEERIRSQAIRTLLDNVPYGVLMVGPDGVVRPGVSDACLQLFPSCPTVEGARLVDVLELDARAAGMLELSIEQVFDDWQPEQVALGQIAKRVQQGHRTLSLEASVVRSTSGAVDALLFTVADISDLVEAERDVETMRSTLAVLQFHERFEIFVHGFDADLTELTATEGPGWETRARRVLHTAKGVFGQFGLSELQQTIHRLEDAPVLEAHHLRQARVALQALLDQRADIWKIHLRSGAATSFQVASTTLDELERHVAAATTVEEVKALVHAHTQAMRSHEARRVLGPIEASVRQLAERRGKDVKVEVSGLDERVPVQLDPVAEQLVHLVRNAVDHGVESPEDRGGKPQTATIAVGMERADATWTFFVEDDGRGVDVNKVVERAVALGIVSPDAAAAMTERQRCLLLFADGLSTADAVTTSSGRGVGLASVQQVVEDLGGHIDVRTTPGQGTRVELVVPDPVGLSLVA